MPRPSIHQQQTPNLLKPHPIARYSSNHLELTKRSSVKRLSAIIFGAIAGSSLPALALALGQNDNALKITSPSTHLQVEQQSTQSSDNPPESSSAGETSSSASVHVNGSATHGSSAEVTINGESVPLENGSVERHYTDESGANVDISITVDGTNTTSDLNISSSSVNISNNSSSTTDTTRGSPQP